MSKMKYNSNPLSMREGKAFIDGVEVLDCIKLTINATPETWSGKQLGERSNSTRWMGVNFSGTITRRRSTNFLEDAIRKYKETGVTPEFTIQGIIDDKASDYGNEVGTHTVTVVGCVLTGDMNLVNLDSNGDVVEDAINFNARDII